MKVALAARPEATPEQMVARGEALDQRLWHLPAPLNRPRAARKQFQAHGMAITSVLSDAAGLDAAFHHASDLGARAIVLEGGALEGADPEEAADRLVRVLHGPLAAGAPIGLRNGASPDDLLGMTEIEWLLSELPRLTLWFDPARALACHRAEAGPSVRRWIDAYAARCAGLFVHGLGSQGLGGAHPTDDGPAWDALRGAVPRAAPWVLSMDPTRGDDEIVDALSWLRALAG